jgi:L-asparaginase II
MNLSRTPEPLVEVRRSGRLESVHAGSVAVCDAEGRLVHSRGNPFQATYLRSSAKFFQTLTVLRLGAADRWGFDAEELALMCASHGAQPLHLRVVRSMFQKAGLSEDQLQCGPHLPSHEPSAEALICAGQKPTRIHNNCSGKHAGMLAACKHKDWPLETYHRPEHPLQQENMATLAAMCGHAGPIPTGNDGCGVPTFYITLVEAATAAARLITPGARPQGWDVFADRIVDAVSQHPIHVDRENHFGAQLLQHLGNQLIGKVGAEGVFVIGLKTKGLGIALKIADGASRAISPVIVGLLRQFISVTEIEPLAQIVLKPLTNTRGEEVGELHFLPS